MALYNFQKRFAPKILSGEKRHTIRAKRARATKAGQMLHLYTGLRQKGAQLLMRTVCTRVETITIGLDGVIWIGESKLDRGEKEALAKSDGFDSFAEMMSFWKGRLPFRGDIIHWSFPPASHATAQEKRKCFSVKGPSAGKSSKVETVFAQRNVDGRTTTKNDVLYATRSAPAKRRARSAD